MPLPLKPGNRHESLLCASAILIAPDSATTREWNGLVLYEWSDPLESASAWRYGCCSCFALTQVETRMGTRTVGSAFALIGVLVFGVAALSFVTVICLHHPRDLSVMAFAYPLGGLALVLGLSLAWTQRIASARTSVRARFQIPGSEHEDRALARQQPARVLQQMARHLQCDGAGTFSRVDTLPAYHQ